MTDGVYNLLDIVQIIPVGTVGIKAVWDNRWGGQGEGPIFFTEPIVAWALVRDEEAYVVDAKGAASSSDEKYITKHARYFTRVVPLYNAGKQLVSPNEDDNFIGTINLDATDEEIMARFSEHFKVESDG